MRCRGLHRFANTPYLRVCSSLACPVLHRIAFPVVSEWCQYHPRIHLRLGASSRRFYDLLRKAPKNPSAVPATASRRRMHLLCIYTHLGEREGADSSGGILAFGCASFPLGATPGAHDGPGDAPAVVLPTFVGLAEDLGQPEDRQ